MVKFSSPLSIGLAICCLVLSFPNRVMAEAGGWSLFSTKSETKDPSPLYSSKSSSKKSWWPEWKKPSMPSWSKQKKTASSYSRNNSTSWQKMSKTSKRWWNNTAEFLDPYPDPKPPVDSSVEKKPKATFSSWFKREEPKKVESVTDFLKQDMVK